MNTLSRGRLTTDIVLAVVFALACLPFALLGNGVDVVVLIGFTAALAIRRLSPGWSLGIAWGAAILQMATLRDLQLYDASVLGVLYSTAAHGGRIV
ncbi:MAG TPA: sensor histidine kinase, partial [Agromyces sp.]|nr:sensor histidine kinase [Agromyces sp.]